MSLLRIHLNLPESSCPAGQSQYLKENPGLEISTGISSFLSSPADLQVFSLPVLRDLWKEGSVPQNFFAVGPSEGVRSAFLLGAQDYLKEPWSWEELHLRAKRVLFPKAFSETRFLQHGFSAKEACIIVRLLESNGKILSREFLGRTYGRSVDTHIWSIRKKLKLFTTENPHILLGSKSDQGYFLSSQGQRTFLALSESPVLS